jgi:hypothetical protein
LAFKKNALRSAPFLKSQILPNARHRRLFRRNFYKAGKNGRQGFRVKSLIVNYLFLKKLLTILNGLCVAFRRQRLFEYHTRRYSDEPPSFFRLEQTSASSQREAPYYLTTFIVCSLTIKKYTPLGRLCTSTSTSTASSTFVCLTILPELSIKLTSPV